MEEYYRKGKSCRRTLLELHRYDQRCTHQQVSCVRAHTKRKKHHGQRGQQRWVYQENVNIFWIIGSNFTALRNPPRPYKASSSLYTKSFLSSTWLYSSHMRSTRFYVGSKLLTLGTGKSIQCTKDTNKMNRLLNGFGRLCISYNQGWWRTCCTTAQDVLASQWPDFSIWRATEAKWRNLTSERHNIKRRIPTRRVTLVLIDWSCHNIKRMINSRWECTPFALRKSTRLIWTHEASKRTWESNIESDK